MATVTIRTRSAKGLARKIAKALPGKVTLANVGREVLEVVHEAFLIKSQGGTDAAGDRWQHLASYTVRVKQASRRKKVRGNAETILMEGGDLERSLRPPAGTRARKDQVFKVGQKDVTVGTSREWSWTHHKGIPPWLPQRRLWPPPDAWPQEWWNRVKNAARMGVVETILKALRGL